jgi:hypothetical protein
LTKTAVLSYAISKQFILSAAVFPEKEVCYGSHKKSGTSKTRETECGTKEIRAGAG